MKRTLIQRLKARLLVSGHKKQQGVAILTVLAIITLMTVLVISFFNMAQTAQSTAKGSVEIQRVTTLKDTIINLVIAQFREASRLAPTANPKAIVAWTSQPGAIRTYSGTDSDQNRIYKLYSSNVPQIRGIAPGESGRALDQINDDIAPDWADRPDEFTDLNRPVYTAATGDRAKATAAKDMEGYSYPIADPRAYNGRSDPLVNTEGFTYSGTSRNKKIRGVDPQDGQLAMPVRWIYQLQDGTLGYLNESKEFTPLNGPESGEVSKTNPIVGRMGWWADDESCKINVNTASVPAIWDTPRTTSLEDIWLAKTQPLAREYQRYPGHPATVDLCAVFFPGRRYASTDGSWDMPIGTSMSRRLTEDEANLIWDLAPFIVSNRTSGQIGTQGGVKTTPNGGTAVALEGDDHLFTSLDELYFKASASKTSSVSALNTPRDNLESQKLDPKGEILRRLEQAQFFLTHKSHSPELTNQGFPRVSMYPMDTLASQYVKPGNTAKPPNTVSPYDITMAVNSTIGGRPYYFQRRQSESRHVELWSTSGANDPARNSNLFKYLKELSRMPIPGYPPNYPGSTAFKLNPAVPEDPEGLSFATKYPSGYNVATSKRFTDSGLNINNTFTLFDASDRTQILLNMLDFTRSLNMQPAFIGAGDRYDAGFGQATAICGCGATGTDANHAKAISSRTVTWRAPKGAGKLLAPAEIAMVVNVVARKNAGGAAPSNPKDWAALVNNLEAASKSIADDDGVDKAIVEIGFVMSGFNPKMGWAPVTGNGGIMITAVAEPAAENNISTANLPLKVTLDGSNQESLKFGKGSTNNTGGVNSTGRKMAGNLIPYGGMQGPRSAIAAAQPNGEGNSATAFNFATLNPFCVRIKAGSADIDVPITDLSGGNAAIRILILDGPPGNVNVTSSLDLRFPSGWWEGLKVPLSANGGGGSLRTKAMNYTALQFPSAAATFRPFPDGSMTVRSLVLPHGDYRLTTSAQMNSDLFVANANWNASKTAHSFYESNSNPSARQMSGAVYNPLTMINTAAAVGVVCPGVTKYITPGPNPAVPLNQVPMSSLPLPRFNQADFALKHGMNPPDTDVQRFASGFGGQARQDIFSHGRLDGHGSGAKRGSSDPDETGDFDTGIAAAEDGPYMNYPDEGDRRKPGGTSVPYFDNLTDQLKTGDGKAAQNISPNFLLRSPVDFGSIPTGLQNRVPWQTLRFRPDPGMNDPLKVMSKADDNPPQGLPFANFCGPRDHFFLDMFWMPVVEPYSISEPFSTKGTINLNQQIFPFLYINRTTALYALLRGERMLAIPNEAADVYKKVIPTSGKPNNNDATYRYFLNVPETVRQFTTRYETGMDPENFPLAFNSFRSASEICEIWLVPDKNGNGRYDGDYPWTLETVIGHQDKNHRDGFWPDHRLTGDNARERPYANLYPRVTVRSNVFKLHMVAQTLQKARSTEPKIFNSLEDLVTAEWRGSCLIERSADSSDRSLTSIDYTTINAANINTTRYPRIDRYYTYRVTEVKQLTQ